MSMDEFKEVLINAFNEAQLPMEAKRYVVRDFYREVEDVYAQTKRMVAKQQAEAAQNGGKE